MSQRPYDFNGHIRMLPQIRVPTPARNREAASLLKGDHISSPLARKIVQEYHFAEKLTSSQFCNLLPLFANFNLPLEN